MRSVRSPSHRAALAAGALLISFGAFAQTAGPSAPGAPAPGSAAPCATPPCGPGGPGAHHRGPGHHAPMLRRIDTDGDGQVSRAELQAAQQRQLERFDKADANGDGRLSRDEIRAMRGHWCHGAMHDRHSPADPAPRS